MQCSYLQEEVNQCDRLDSFDCAGDQTIVHMRARELRVGDQVMVGTRARPLVRAQHSNELA